MHERGDVDMARIEAEDSGMGRWERTGLDGWRRGELAALPFWTWQESEDIWVWMADQARQRINERAGCEGGEPGTGTECPMLSKGEEAESMKQRMLTIRSMLYRQWST